jgi:hypothetical protein
MEHYNQIIKNLITVAMRLYPSMVRKKPSWPEISITIGVSARRLCPVYTFLPSRYGLWFITRLECALFCTTLQTRWKKVKDSKGFVSNSVKSSSGCSFVSEFQSILPSLRHGLEPFSKGYYYSIHILEKAKKSRKAVHSINT